MIAALPTNNVNIRSQGKIIAEKIPVTVKSEIRGVFIHENLLTYNHNWSVIAKTLNQYGIDAVFANFVGRTGELNHLDEWTIAINAFHSYGIEFHVVWNVIGDVASGETYKAEDENGNKVNWNCPTKIKDLVNETLHEILSYNIDGIMLDYVRYNSAHICYCSECRSAFEEWLGENITDWSPFYPGGSRYADFAEWRTIPITEIVKLIHDEAKTIKPYLTISASVWTYFSDTPTYWRYWIGQDTGKWIKEGYIDFVAPMMYTTQIYGKSGETLESFMDACQNYMTGGVEGKVPLVPILRNCEVEVPPENFSLQVSYIRSRGADGWIIYAYNGPGGNPNYPVPDITEYLNLIELPQTFAISNIHVETSEGSATITWLTTLPATSKVEYSISPLFGASWETKSGFHYWKITRNNVTISENLSTISLHLITLNNLTPNDTYYFRVQSSGLSGTATSPILMFSVNNL